MNFLSNPFFQINQYACPNDHKFFEQSEVVLPEAGIIKMVYNLVQSPKCREGVLGLTKDSSFISYLPINLQSFYFRINKRENIYKQQIFLAFGQIETKPKALISYSSNVDNLWELSGQIMTLDSITLQEYPKIILTSDDYLFKVPSTIYQMLMKYFPENLSCRHETQTNKTKCLCNGGISKQFPSFKLTLGSNQYQKTKIIINPSQYMSIDSNICTILFQQSTKPTKWMISISLLQDKILFFDHDRIIIEEISATATFSMSQGVLASTDIAAVNKKTVNILDLPLQLILNIGVILLLCVFVALLIVEMIKRISGLSEVDEEGVRGYMLGAYGRFH